MIFFKKCFLCLDSVVELLKDEFVQEKIDEVARLFYSNDSVTINLYAAAAAGLLALLRKKYFFYLWLRHEFKVWCAPLSARLTLSALSFFIAQNHHRALTSLTHVF